MNIAVIPARGGSKRIPRKNIKPFAGKPMIAHAILAAKASGLFDHVVVSTDDAEIAEVAGEWGAEVPFARPAELSDDHAPTSPVIAHAIRSCEDYGWEIEHACCIYPAAPFIRIEDLKGAYDLLLQSKTDYSFAVTEFSSAVQRALRRLPDGTMQPFYPQYEMTRTQDLEPAFHDAGQFYWGKKDAWLSGKKVHSGGAGYAIPNWRVVDIDNVDDWKRAELFYELLGSKK